MSVVAAISFELVHVAAHAVTPFVVAAPVVGAVPAQVLLPAAMPTVVVNVNPSHVALSHRV